VNVDHDDGRAAFLAGLDAFTGCAGRTVETLARADAPRTWPDETVALLGTGRVTPDTGQRAAAPDLTRQLPVLG
jgi:hypothetical protein